MARILITIDPTGQHISIQPEGYHGSDCHTASAPFLHAFGGTILTQQATAEALLVAPVTSQQHSTPSS